MKDSPGESASSLSDHGIHLFMKEFDESSCAEAIEWILEENLKPKGRRKLLTLLLCSGGGDLSAAFALVDIMRGSKIPIRTVGLGCIASAALITFIAGQKGQRILTPNTSIMSHQFSWGTWGKEHELLAAVKEYELCGQRIVDHYKQCTGLTEKEIRKHLLPEKDAWLSAEEALKLGVCDDIKIF